MTSGPFEELLAATELEDEEDPVLKEMFDAQIPRVDAVIGPAHRMRFVVVKAMKGRTATVPRELTLKSLAIANPPQRFVLGVAYPADTPDGHSEWMSADELEEAAWDFERTGGQIGFYHVEGAATLGHADVVESYIWRGPDWVTTGIDGKEQVIKAGDWVLGAILDESAFDLVRRGKADGWSVDGVARRRVKAPQRSSAVRKSEDPFAELLASTDQLLLEGVRNAARNQASVARPQAVAPLPHYDGPPKGHKPPRVSNDGGLTWKNFRWDPVASSWRSPAR